MSVEEFIGYYKRLGKKISKPYYHLLKGFEKWLIMEGKTMDNFTPNDVELYMAQMAETSPRSANLFLSAIRKYAEWRARNAMADEDFIKEERRVWALRGIRMIKVAREIKKESLNERELKRLLEATLPNPTLFMATVVHFYFGWRPVEGAQLMKDAKIFWDDNYMIIKTAKVGNERILTWAPVMKPIIKSWHLFVLERLSNMSYPQEWYTKAIKPVAARLGMKVTARTARKTFETQMRKAGVEQWAINFLLGHTTTIPDVYTDWSVLRNHLNEIMAKKHYMLPILRDVLGGWDGGR